MKEAIRTLGKSMALLVLLVAANCVAQFNAGVQGNVVDPKGSAIADANIELDERGHRGQAGCNEQSKRRVSILEPGSRQLYGHGNGCGLFAGDRVVQSRDCPDSRCSPESRSAAGAVDRDGKRTGAACLTHPTAGLSRRLTRPRCKVCRSPAEIQPMSSSWRQG